MAATRAAAASAVKASRNRCLAPVEAASPRIRSPSELLDRGGHALRVSGRHIDRGRWPHDLRHPRQPRVDHRSPQGEGLEHADRVALVMAGHEERPPAGDTPQRLRIVPHETDAVRGAGVGRLPLERRPLAPVADDLELEAWAPRHRIDRQIHGLYRREARQDAHAQRPLVATAREGSQGPDLRCRSMPAPPDARRRGAAASSRLRRKPRSPPRRTTAWRQDRRACRRPSGQPPRPRRAPAARAAWPPRGVAPGRRAGLPCSGARGAGLPSEPRPGPRGPGP